MKLEFCFCIPYTQTCSAEGLQLLSVHINYKHECDTDQKLQIDALAKIELRHEIPGNLKEVGTVNADQLATVAYAQL